MKIGIIGAGNIGGELVRKFRKLGHVVRVSNSRGPESLKDIADETGAIASTTEEVVGDSELIIISVIQKAIPSLREAISKAPSHAIILDTGNHYRFRDGDVPEIDEENLTHTEWASSVLGRPLLKAFNNILADSLINRAYPVGHPNRFALPVAGDNTEHKKVVIDLIDSIGFDAIDAGPATESWRQQPGSPAYCTDYDAATLRKVLEGVIREELVIRSELVMARIITGVKITFANVNVAWLRAASEESFKSVLAAHKEESLWLKK